MSDDEAKALGLRALGAGFCWQRGCVTLSGMLFVAHADCGEATWLWCADDGCEWLPVAGEVPDLRDPATLGVLLAQVRKAWGERVWVKWWSGGVDMGGGDRSWCEVVDRAGRRIVAGERVRYSAEAAALVAALEAAREVGR